MLTLTASGSVSDYSDSDKASLQQKVADAAGVDKSLVTIRVAAASVRITATIRVPASTTVDIVQNALSSKLSTADAASTALGVTVEAVPTITIADGGSDLLPKEEREESSCSTQDGGCIGGLMGGCFGIVCVLLCVFCLRGKCRRSEASRKPTSPEANRKPTGKSEADVAEVQPTGRSLVVTP